MRKGFKIFIGVLLIAMLVMIVGPVIPQLFIMK